MEARNEADQCAKRRLGAVICTIAGLGMGGVYLYQSIDHFRVTSRSASRSAEAAEAGHAAAESRNALLAVQNRLLDRQASAAKDAEVATTLEWASNEIRAAGGVVTDAVEGRLIGLSQRLGPADVVGDDGLMEKARWSRDRGQLVVALSGLGVTNFRKFFVRNADLSGLELRKRTLDWLQVFDGNLNRANLHQSSIQDSVFTDGELRGVRMQGCDLTRTVLLNNVMVGADLRGATLEGIHHWDENDWLCANVHGVKNAPDGFVEFVLDHGGLSVPDEFWEEALLIDGLKNEVIPMLMESSQEFAKRYNKNLQSALGIALRDDVVRKGLVAGIKAYQAKRDAEGP